MHLKNDNLPGSQRFFLLACFLSKECFRRIEADPVVHVGHGLTTECRRGDSSTFSGLAGSLFFLFWSCPVPSRPVLHGFTEQVFNLTVYAPKFLLSPCFQVRPKNGVDAKQKWFAFRHSKTINCRGFPY